VVVVRSAAALDRYGPDFAYSHFASFPGPVTAAVLSAGAVGGLLLARVPPGRRLLLRLRPAGSGPSAEQRAKSWFRVRFVGEGGGRRVVTEVRGGDPGYDETAVMLAEAATCMAVDDLSPTSGQVTTAVAMGPVLRRRLQRRGITFEVLEKS
ncbi:MAG: saccharopine dehydrogenase, partial [Actinomycetes bacterium]